MISDRYDSSNDMNPAIEPFNHPTIPYIYELNFSKFEKSLIELIENNVQFGKLLCRLDINGTGEWKDADFTYEKRTYQQKNGERENVLGLKVRYILHFHDTGRYDDALAYMNNHWIPGVSELVIAKLKLTELDTSEMPNCSIRIPVSKDLARQLNAKKISSIDHNKLNDAVAHFISDLVSRMSGNYDPSNDVLVWVKDHFEWRHAGVDVKVREPLDWNGDPNDPVKYAVIRSENPPESGFEHAIIRSENPLENDKYGWR